LSEIAVRNLYEMIYVYITYTRNLYVALKGQVCRSVVGHNGGEWGWVNCKPFNAEMVNHTKDFLRKGTPLHP